jgi:hypothetical protein
VRVGVGIYNHDLKFCATVCFYSVLQVTIFIHICNKSITQKVCQQSRTTIIMKGIRDEVKVISGNIFQ